MTILSVSGINVLMSSIMEKIKKVWFEDGSICILTDEGRTGRIPEEMLPSIKEATEEDRMDFEIGKFGNDIHWNALDEDLHISSFSRFTLLKKKTRLQ